MRNIGGSVGISIVEALFVQNTQVVHSDAAGACPARTTRSPRRHCSAAPYSLTKSAGSPALNREITRQAQMIAYIDDFHLMVIIMLVASPFLLLLRRPRRAADGPAVAMD